MHIFRNREVVDPCSAQPGNSSLLLVHNYYTGHHLHSIFWAGGVSIIVFLWMCMGPLAALQSLYFISSILAMITKWVHYLQYHSFYILRMFTSTTHKSCRPACFWLLARWIQLVAAQLVAIGYSIGVLAAAKQVVFYYVCEILETRTSIQFNI